MGRMFNRCEPVSLVTGLPVLLSKCARDSVAPIVKGEILLMKNGIRFSTVIGFFLGAAVLAPSLSAQGRQCSGNGDIIGAYGFAGSRAGFSLLGATAPGPHSPA